MDALEQNDYDVFRRDVYRVSVSNESQQSRRIVRSIDEDDEDEDLDDLEALRLAALRSLGSKNSCAKRGSTTADVGDTRRVSLGREDKSDLQIVALERQGSFSSSSTDYEEIDLNAPSDVVANEDKRTFPDSDENDSELDDDNSDGEEKYISDSQIEDETLETTCGYEQEDEREGYDDDDDDVVVNSDILTDDDIANNMADSEDDDVENDDALTDDEDVQHKNELTYEEDVENVSDDDAGEDIETNSPNSSEGVEDNLLDSVNEINILNDISITITNENLLTNNSEELVDNEKQRNESILEHESDSKQIKNKNLISPQRIIVGRSDSEDDNDNEVKNENEIKEQKEQVAFKSEVQSDGKQEKTDSTVLSVTASLKTPKKNLLTKGKENTVVNVKKTTDLNVKPSAIVVKRNAQLSTLKKHELATTCANKAYVRQEMLHKGKTGQKTTEVGNEEGKAQRLKDKNKNSLIKAVKDDGKITTTSKTETEALNPEIEDKKNMDFDQLSIEDEDSDFVEEEEDLPAVKSKVGLNKIPAEHLRAKRSSSRENNRKRRRSYSPERSRTTLRSYRNQSPLRDRLRDQRLRDRSRERFRRRSHSPPSRDRTYRGNYSRRERSRSRERTHNRITNVGKNRENRRYRSRSRSVSRTRSGRTEKDFKPNVSKLITKDNVKGSVKERLNIKKERDARMSSRSPRKEMKTQDDSDKVKKAVKVRESKSSTAALVANGVKAESQPKTVKSTEVNIKQSKDLRTRLSEKKVDQDTEIKQKTVEKDSTNLIKERELDERIQRIKQQNEAILKRANEVKAEKLKFS